MKRLKNLPLELIFWVAALVALATNNPIEHRFTLCPLSILGFEVWCPGCGLGRSISFLFQGEFALSVQQHWLGIPAVGIILYRIYQLSTPKKDYKNLTQLTN